MDYHVALTQYFENYASCIKALTLQECCNSQVAVNLISHCHAIRFLNKKWLQIFSSWKWFTYLVHLRTKMWRNVYYIVQVCAFIMMSALHNCLSRAVLPETIVRHLVFSLHHTISTEARSVDCMTDKGRLHIIYQNTIRK